MGCPICDREVIRADAVYCSVRHRVAGHRARGRALYNAWIALPLPAEAVDAEIAIIGASPDGAAWYRLACPGLWGGSRYFPKGRRLGLSPFETPEVPRPGIYRAVYFDVWDDVITEVDGIVMLTATPGVYLSRGDTSP